MWVTKILISPVKIRIFCPKMTKFGTFDHCRLIWCPGGGLAGGCGTQAVSRKTPIYFIELQLPGESGIESLRSVSGSNDYHPLATLSSKSVHLGEQRG